jgi:transposase
MRTFTWSALKCDSLRRHASLNPHPEQVSDQLFQTHPFFDPCDLVQVKYEMQRRVNTEGKPVGITVAAFGFSRVTWAQLRKRFEVGGMVGLLPQHKGPRRASKLSEEVVAFIQQTLLAEPALRMEDLSERIARRFGLSVHVRSIQRALANSRKKEYLQMKQAQFVRILLALNPVSYRRATRCCVIWPWKLAVQGFLSLTVWSWPSSSARGWRPGWRCDWQAVARPIFRRRKCESLCLLLTGWSWPWRTWSWAAAKR